MKIFLVVCFISVFSVSDIFGKLPSDYRRNISEARILVLELLYPEGVNEIYSEDRKKTEGEIIKKIREKIPPTEKIEWDGNVIETNNTWLSTKLNAFEDEPPESAKRTQILNEIEERLSSLEREVKELESPPVSNSSKDESKQKLAEILRREEFKKPVEEEKSLFQRFWDWLMELLGGIFPKPEIAPTPVTGFQPLSVALQAVILIAVLGIIGFIAYRFAPLLIGKFGRKKESKSKERVILGEKLSADTDASDLFKDAELLAREGDLRGAIRKGYIALLCDLSDRKIIGLSQHKTNRDYLRDVRKQRELHENMNGLTLNFERHWYGFDEAENTDWEEFKDGYRKALSSEQ